MSAESDAAWRKDAAGEVAALLPVLVELIKQLQNPERSKREAYALSYLARWKLSKTVASLGVGVPTPGESQWTKAVIDELRSR
jgi:hypothetical protein